MGCDIHEYAEVRRNGRWEYYKNVQSNQFFDANRPESVENPRFEFFIDRNYRLFAILANVRNRWGMGYIAERRYRIPTDVSEEVLSAYALRVVDGEPDNKKPECSRSDAQRWISEPCSVWIEEGRLVRNPSWHSASWHSLRNLLVHNWQTLEPFVEIVDADGYQKFKQSGRLWSYFDGPESGHEITIDEMEQRIAAGTATHHRTVVRRGKATHASFAGEFFTESLPALFRLAVGSDNPEAFALARAVLDGDKTALAPLDDWLLEHGCLSLDDVRMVFWFDN